MPAVPRPAPAPTPRPAFVPPRPRPAPPAFRSPEGPAPYWTDPAGRARLWQGDSASVLAKLPARSVQCVVTSPPYWGLRDYGTCSCAQSKPQANIGENGSGPSGGTEPGRSRKAADPDCPSCGGTGRVKGMEAQLGAEPSPDCGGWAGRLSADVLYKIVLSALRAAGDDHEFTARSLADTISILSATREPCGRCFVCSMVRVFRGVRRVLRDDGTLWLNLGDTYGGNAGKGASGEGKNSRHLGGREATLQTRAPDAGLAPGNLVGVPWRVALALQADGWVLRQDIIWAKPSPMPESVRNRCTKAHEYVFLFAKGPGYFCDMEAIKEPLAHANAQRTTSGYNTAERYGAGNGGNSGLDTLAARMRKGEHGGRNRRDVWAGDDHAALREWLAGRHPDTWDEFLGEAGAAVPDVWRVSSGGGYRGAHFATFPAKLIEPMILAGTSAAGCCSGCGAPYRRVTEREALKRQRPNEYVKRTGAEGTGNSCGNTVAGVSVTTVGWEAGCKCVGGGGGGRPAAVPCVVLDPFLGAATTAAVALRHGRHAWGIELNEKYIDEHCVPRCEGALAEGVVAGGANAGGKKAAGRPATGDLFEGAG